MKCPNCNEAEHELNAKYCHVCGASLVDIIQPQEIFFEVPNPTSRSVDSFAPSGVEAIDLGLPSGTKWASCNVGATRPEEFGGYYAWGEITEKSVYDWQTYNHCDGAIESCHDIGTNICGTQYDIAHVMWGGRWQMPSSDHINELIRNCRYEWTRINGINGGRFIGSNGNSIFLPATGYRDSSGFISPSSYVDVGFGAEYLSGSQNSPFIEYAFCLNIYYRTAEGRHTERCLGNPIRPVAVL